MRTTINEKTVINDADDGKVSTTIVRFVKHSELVKVKLTIEHPPVTRRANDYGKRHSFGSRV